MNIKVDVNVSAPELAESINHLATVLPQIVSVKDAKEEPEKVVSTEPKKEDKPKKKTTRKTAPKKAEVKEPLEDVTAKEITVEEVRSKLAALSQEGKQVQVKKLITSFGAKKLSDIPKEKYQELLEKASDL